ncbi:Glycosyl-phosphatidylinositol-anchored molecule-like protein [Lemmus lemmus]
MRCHDCTVENTFHCPNEKECPQNFRRCATIAMRMNSRQLLIYKYCMGNCTFMIDQPPPAFRRIKNSNSFYFSYCCASILCNDGGPTNQERDLLPPRVIEEDITAVARATCLGQFNLLLSLALVLFSSILT